jgi:hypothetical protein
VHDDLTDGASLDRAGMRPITGCQGTVVLRHLGPGVVWGAEAERTPAGTKLTTALLLGLSRTTHLPGRLSTELLVHSTQQWLTQGYSAVPQKFTAPEHSVFTCGSDSLCRLLNWLSYLLYLLRLSTTSTCVVKGR